MSSSSVLKDCIILMKLGLDLIVLADKSCSMLVMLSFACLYIGLDVVQRRHCEVSC